MLKFILMIPLMGVMVLAGDSSDCLAQAVSDRYRPGLRNSAGERQLDKSQLQKVVDSLRHKTGFQEMHFDQSGFLTIGDRTQVCGGSETARTLLAAAVDGHQAIELQADNHSPRVAFAAIQPGAIYTHFQTKARIKVWHLQLDFADFGELRGTREAITAFDLGFAVLHELVHGVLGLSDGAEGQPELGACDEQINRVRRELNLPERQVYGAQVIQPGLTSTKKQSELIFARPRSETGQGGAKWFYLRWDTERVAYDSQSKRASL
jgi:hypothetical protein